AADEFDAGNEGLRCLDVFLNQRDAVDRWLEGVTFDMARECVDAVEELDTKPFAGAVVLGDEAARHRPRGFDNRLGAHRCNRPWHANALSRQSGVLRGLADLELERTSAVDGTATVPLETSLDAGG